MAKIVDLLGQEITPKSIVMRAVRNGNVAFLSLAVVSKIEGDKVHACPVKFSYQKGSYVLSKRAYVLQRLDAIMVIPLNLIHIEKLKEFIKEELQKI